MSQEIEFLFGIFFFLCLIVWIANIAEKRRQQGEPYFGIALVSYLALASFYALLVLIGLFLSLQPQLLNQTFAASGTSLRVEQFASFPLFVHSIWAPPLLGIISLAPQVRHLVARLIPIDAQNPVHAIAIALIPLVGVNLGTTLGLGLEQLNQQISEQQSAGMGETTLLTLWLQQIFMAIFAMIGVGWFARRGLSATLRRLGIVIPTLRQVLLGIGLALALLPTVLLVEYLSRVLGWGENQAVNDLTEQLLGPLFKSPWGVITVGVAAALGEETLLRGAAQPRFGLLLTSAIFALLHNNYGFSISTVIVLGLGLLLGIVRIRTNTTTAMIVHAVYNSTLALLVYLNVPV